MEKLLKAIREGKLGGWIIHPLYVDFCDGNHYFATILSRILFYYSTDLYPKHDPKFHTWYKGHYWLVKQHSEWDAECRIKARTARRAIRYLEEENLIITRVGFSARHIDEDGTIRQATYIRINWEGLEAKIKTLLPHGLPELEDMNESPAIIDEIRQSEVPPLQDDHSQDTKNTDGTVSAQNAPNITANDDPGETVTQITEKSDAVQALPAPASAPTTIQSPASDSATENTLEQREQEQPAAPAQDNVETPAMSTADASQQEGTGATTPHTQQTVSASSDTQINEETSSQDASLMIHDDDNDDVDDNDENDNRQPDLISEMLHEIGVDQPSWKFAKNWKPKELQELISRSQANPSVRYLPGFIVSQLKKATVLKEIREDLAALEIAATQLEKEPEQSEETAPTNTTAAAATPAAEKTTESEATPTEKTTTKKVKKGPKMTYVEIDQLPGQPHPADIAHLHYLQRKYVDRDLPPHIPPPPPPRPHRIAVPADPQDYIDYIDQHRIEKAPPPLHRRLPPPPQITNYSKERELSPNEAWTLILNMLPDYIQRTPFNQFFIDTYIAEYEEGEKPKFTIVAYSESTRQSISTIYMSNVLTLLDRCGYKNAEIRILTREELFNHLQDTGIIPKDDEDEE